MKTKEQIEQLAVDIIKTRFNETDGYHKLVYVEAYVSAYLKCQEDFVKFLLLHTDDAPNSYIKSELSKLIDTAIFKFNNGNGALLCSKCSVIIKTGIQYTAEERSAATGTSIMLPQYCEKCK